jgi:hypothetical protein
MSLGFRNSLYGRSIVAIAGFLSLTGCFGRFERPRTPAVIAVPSPDGRTGNYTLDNYSKDLQKYADATDPAAATRVRNKMVYSLIAEIDYAFGLYESKLFLNQGNFNIGSDFLQLGLAAGSTITNGARAKTILSALLSGVTGTSLSVDKNFFRQQTVQAITSSMEANRDRIKTIILEQLKQDTTTYPFEAARSDLIKYFFAGTLPAGLQQLHQDAATNAQSQQANLNQVQVTNISATDVKAATDVNQGITKVLLSDDLSKVITFLRAMGVTVDDNAGREKVSTAIRDLGRKITTDETLRKKYFDEAKKAGLIQ